MVPTDDSFRQAIRFGSQWKQVSNQADSEVIPAPGNHRTNHSNSTSVNSWLTVRVRGPDDYRPPSDRAKNGQDARSSSSQ